MTTGGLGGDGGGGGFPRYQEGLSIRDYFAAAALTPVLGARVAVGAEVTQTPINRLVVRASRSRSIAEECYELADALLVARQTARPMSAGGQMPPVPADTTVVSPGL